MLTGADRCAQYETEKQLYLIVKLLMLVCHREHKARTQSICQTV